MNLPRNTAIVDVGGNIGYYTLAYSLAWPAAKILTIEPSRNNFKYLIRNCDLVERLHAVNVGLHSHDGEAILRMPTKEQYPRVVNSPDSTGLLSMYGANSASGERIKLTTLDRLLSQIGLNLTVGFAKIDVEGNELNVLRGATNLLVHSAPVLEIEVNPPLMTAAGYTYVELRAFLSDFGYTPWVFDGQSLAPYGSSDIYQALNMVFRKNIQQERWV